MPSKAGDGRLVGTGDENARLVFADEGERVKRGNVDGWGRTGGNSQPVLPTRYKAVDGNEAKRR